MDYKEIIDNLKVSSVKELMRRLGAEAVKEDETQIIFPTVCHNGDGEMASPKLYFYKNTKMFYCYTECGAMSIFKFLKHYYEARDIEYDWVTDIYNVVMDCSNFNPTLGFAKPRFVSLRDKYGAERKQIQLPEYNRGALDTFIRRYPPEWTNDGISHAAIDKFDIRYSISQNKIIIPHKDVDGRLVGIRGRALNEWEIENVGKYMPIKLEQTWYKHPLSMNLYGLYENKAIIKKHKVVYIFESEKSVLQFESFNMPHCAVAVCGSQFNKYQLNILLKHCAPNEIVICLDREENEGETKYFDKLYALCKKYTQYCQFSFIYDRLGLTKMKDSPSDNGEEIFKQLLIKRVRVR